MSGSKNVDQSGKKKETSDNANQSERNVEIVRFDGPMSEQAQLASSSHNEAPHSLSKVFGIEGWNSSNFKGKEIPMTDEIYWNEKKREEERGRRTQGGTRRNCIRRGNLLANSINGI